jgi:hypothetical protein
MEEDRMTTPARPSPILDLYRHVTPCLTVDDAAENRRAASERLHEIQMPWGVPGSRLAIATGGAVVTGLTTEVISGE